MKKLWALAMAVASIPAHAAISGKVEGASVRLQLAPSQSEQAKEMAMFVAIYPLIGGQPATAVGGYFNGRAWIPSSAPVPAYVGRLRAQTATLPLTGEVCSMVKAAGGPEGPYGIYAGWGGTDLDLGQGVSEADVQEAIDLAGGEDENTAQLRQLLTEYQAAAQKLQQSNNKSAIAFMGMQNAGSFWKIHQFNCGAIR